MEYPHLLIRHTSSKGPFSIAMLVYQSVYIFVEDIRYSNPTIFSKKILSTSGSVRLGDKPPIMNQCHVVDEVNFSSSE